VVGPLDQASSVSSDWRTDVIGAGGAAVTAILDDGSSADAAGCVFYVSARWF